MTILEWMAWALIAVSVVKIAVVLVNPRAWVRYVSKPFYTNSIWWFISLVAVLGGFYYLTRELTVVQIFASFFVISFLISFSLRPYAKELFAAFDRSLGDGSFLRKSWFPLILWSVLIAWGAYYLIRY